MGGPHDGKEAIGDVDHFDVIVGQSPDRKNPDGTVSRDVYYNTYYWVSETKTWRWKANG